MKHNICPTCKTKASYCDRFDALYCPECNTWLEKPCSDFDLCEFCKTRPEKPSMFYNHKPKTFSTMIGPAYALDYFMALVASGSIMEDDGTVGAIFIDGVDNTDIWIPNWSFTPNDIRLCKEVSLQELPKKFPNKTIQLEWLTK